MNKKLDRETQERLLGAMVKLKADGARRDEYRIKQLWGEVSFPCSLYDAINRLTKDDMTQVRQKYGFTNISALKKADLAVELARRVPERFKGLLRTLNQDCYDLIKAIVENSGVIIDPGVSLSIAEAYLRYGIVYPGIYEDKKVLFMPAELVSIFAELDGPELQSIIGRNTEWTLLAQGLLYFYGIMDAGPIAKRLEELTEGKVDTLELIQVLSFASNFYGQVRHTSYGYKDARVLDVARIIAEQGKRTSVDYYPFTKQQLLRAGKPGYVHITSALNSFMYFLSLHYEMTDEQSKDITSQITIMINAESSLPSIIQYVQTRFQVPSEEFLHRLTKEVQELYNNTRQWALKGHTPAELFEEERKYLRPLPAEPFKIEKTSTAVAEPQARRTKVGRNDPCPCASGKKYKKCCGKF